MNFLQKQIITDFNRHQPLLSGVDEVDCDTFRTNKIKII